MKTRQSKTGRLTGFTQTELLVVIAITVLVAALLFPVFAHARDRARQATCLNSLHQIGMAALQYVHDYDDTLFPVVQSVGEDVISWDGYLSSGNDPLNASQYRFDYSRGLLSPYAKDGSIFQCPSAPSIGSADGARLIDGSPMRANYGVNMIYLSSRHHIVTLAQASRPSETLWVADSASLMQDGRLSQGILMPPSRHIPGVQGRHPGGACLLWLDGHANTKMPIISYTGKGGQTPTQFNMVHVGDILQGPYTGNATTDNYYYELDKPQ